MSDDLRGALNGMLGRAGREPLDWQVFHGAPPPLPRPDGFPFVESALERADLPDDGYDPEQPIGPDNMPLMTAPRGGIEYVTHTIPISTTAAVEMGLIPPPPGWTPWRPPAQPWHTRVRVRTRMALHRARMRVASLIAGFDVEEDRCGC